MLRVQGIRGPDPPVGCRGCRSTPGRAPGVPRPSESQAASPLAHGVYVRPCRCPGRALRRHFHHRHRLLHVLRRTQWPGVSIREGHSKVSYARTGYHVMPSPCAVPPVPLPYLHRTSGQLLGGDSQSVQRMRTCQCRCLKAPRGRLRAAGGRLRPGGPWRRRRSARWRTAPGGGTAPAPPACSRTRTCSSGFHGLIRLRYCASVVGWWYHASTTACFYMHTCDRTAMQSLAALG